MSNSGLRPRHQEINTKKESNGKHRSSLPVTYSHLGRNYIDTWRGWPNKVGRSTAPEIHSDESRYLAEGTRNNASPVAAVSFFPFSCSAGTFVLHATSSLQTGDDAGRRAAAWVARLIA